jgi:alkylation response protein AidB-like acyl-CoA dehydrogenase
VPAPDAFAELERHAGDADARSVWPESSWQALRATGALGWCVPRSFGGMDLVAEELLTAYERLAGTCLTTSFILSQRDAACRRIRDGDSDHLREQLLPALASGEIFATVGISQLTTSRQHGGPAMTADLNGDELRLNGSMPWVTGAARADVLVAGAACGDGRQVLVVVPRDTPGVEVGPPLDLMALQGSMTAEVRCRDVRVDRRWLLAGPRERVMASGRGGTGGLETSCLALGLAGAAIDYLRGEAVARPDLATTRARLDEVRRQLRTDLHGLAGTECSADAAAVLRARANSLVLRSTQVALTAAKGTGFLRSHPAQRWARQALFFLVWSCPRPAAEATVASLVPPDGPVCS